MTTDFFPILSTTDIERSLRFYRDQLGGVLVYESPGPDGHPGYVSMDIGGSHLGIGRSPDPVAIETRKAVSLWLYTADCDALIESLRQAGVEILEDPVDQPWGERVGRVQNPDGIDVHIASRPSVDLERRAPGRCDPGAGREVVLRGCSVPNPHPRWIPTTAAVDGDPRRRTDVTVDSWGPQLSLLPPANGPGAPHRARRSARQIGLAAADRFRETVPDSWPVGNVFARRIA